MSDNQKFKRKLKLDVLNFPEWKKNSTCYIFSLRPNGVNPDTTSTWSIDTWFKVDYGNPDLVYQTVTMIKLRAKFNMSSVYGVWLTNSIATDIDIKDNPEDYMELLMKYRFKV